jgi:hypothetical protein
LVMHPPPPQFEQGQNKSISIKLLVFITNI